MNRWARVTNQEDGCSIWINESHVTFIKDYKDGGSMVGFSTEEDDVVQINEGSEDIFVAWDNWQATQEGCD